MPSQHVSGLAFEFCETLLTSHRCVLFCNRFDFGEQFDPKVITVFIGGRSQDREHCGSKLGRVGRKKQYLSGSCAERLSDKTRLGLRQQNQQ